MCIKSGGYECGMLRTASRSMGHKIFGNFKLENDAKRMFLLRYLDGMVGLPVENCGGLLIFRVTTNIYVEL